MGDDFFLFAQGPSEREVGAGASVGGGDGFAYASAGAGDDCNFIFEDHGKTNGMLECWSLGVMDSILTRILVSSQQDSA